MKTPLNFLYLLLVTVALRVVYCSSEAVSVCSCTGVSEIIFHPFEIESVA